MTKTFVARGSGGYEWPLVPGIEDRFWAKVDISDQCWVWTAFINGSGYGMIRNGSAMALAHRVSYVMHRQEPIPPRMHLLHKCDQPNCVRPDHLYVGTNSDNMRDKVVRGRSSYPQPWRRGSLHHNAKLTEDDVREIRRRSSTITGRDLAAEYGVSPSVICVILKRKTWRHVD